MELRMGMRVDLDIGLLMLPLWHVLSCVPSDTCSNTLVIFLMATLSPVNWSTCAQQA